MRHLLIMLPVALAACGSGPSVDAENASVAEVNEKVKAAGGTNFLTPGQWQSTVTVSKMDMPGLPPEVMRQMQGELTKPRQTSSCLTPQDAKKPAADFFAGKDSKECRYDHFRMADGKLDAKMTCNSGGAAMVAAFDGTYAPETFKLNMTMKGAAGGTTPMPDMALTVDARRTGECTAKAG